MEEKFYNDNFENLISKHADDFKMYPSKKAWHGIYNHLHPGKKWPSTAVSTLLLVSLLLVGHLNTNNDRLSLDLSSDQQSFTENKTETVRQTAAGNSRVAKVIPITAALDHSTLENINAEAVVEDESSALQDARVLASLQTAINTIRLAVMETQQSTSESGSGTAEDYTVQNRLATDKQTSTSAKASVDITAELPSQTATIVNNDLHNEGASSTKSTDETTTALTKADAPEPQVNTVINQAEHFQTFSETVIGKLLKSKKHRTTWKLHVTPNFSFRKFEESEDLSMYNASLGPVLNTPAPAKSLDHRLALGFELGGSMLKELGKGAKMTAGLQFNYVGYNIQAYSVHPVTASLMLRNETTGQEYPLSDVSNYSNIKGANPVTLRNQQLQVSFPVGAQYQFYGNDRVKFDIGAILQPSFVIAGKSYLPSVDKRHYLYEPSLLRRWNLSTAIETFASFKAGSSLTMHIGPQLRYQLLSTYNDKYTIREHLFDYGIKFAVSKSLR